jgi:hypothetical protein
MLLSLIACLAASLDINNVTFTSLIDPSQFSSQAKRRPADRLNAVKSSLYALRNKFWKEKYSDTVFPPAALLSDTMISTLASEAKVKTMDDLRLLLPRWIFADELGPLALETIKETDSNWQAEHRGGIEKRDN